MGDFRFLGHIDCIVNVIADEEVIGELFDMVTPEGKSDLAHKDPLPFLDDGDDNDKD
jgi:hypothetical protein